MWIVFYDLKNINDNIWIPQNAFGRLKWELLYFLRRADAFIQRPLNSIWKRSYLAPSKFVWCITPIQRRKSVRWLRPRNCQSSWSKHMFSGRLLTSSMRFPPKLSAGTYLRISFTRSSTLHNSAEKKHGGRRHVGVWCLWTFKSQSDSAKKKKYLQNGMKLEDIGWQ